MGGARRRTLILTGIALLLCVGNATYFLIANTSSDDANPDTMVGLWFGFDQASIAQSHDGDWPKVRRPMVRLNAHGATREGRAVPYTDMVENMGRSAYDHQSAHCVDGCSRGPWFASAAADPDATMAIIISAVRAIRKRCNVEVVIYDGSTAKMTGHAMFLARIRDVHRMADVEMFGFQVNDPSLLNRRPQETDSQFWTRTGCVQLNPLRP
jgi:hypothetical protein